MKIKEKERLKESYQDLGGKPFEDLTWNRQKKKKKGLDRSRKKREREKGKRKKKPKNTCSE